MCLINFEWKTHPVYKFILVSNRDEFYQRPAKAADFWEDEPQILAGRDLEQMGTWLGITKEGRFAALTNYRDMEMEQTGKQSRGDLVRNFLSSETPPQAYLAEIQKDPARFNGFNLLVGTTEELWYLNNLENKVEKVSQGIHGVSNHFLDTPWPKNVKGMEKLKKYTSATNQVDPSTLFDIIADAEEAPDTQLPETGIGYELEKKLSSMFIKTPDYGTRVSTVLLIDYDNTVTFVERTYNKGAFANDRTFTFPIK